MQLRQWTEAVPLLRASRDGSRGIEVALARSLANTGAFVEARQVFERLIEKDASDFAVFLGYGRVLSCLGEWDGAAGAFERCCAFAVDEASDVRARLCLIAVLARSGRKSEAEATCQAMVRQRPGSVRGHYALGVLAYDDNRLTAAQEAFRAAIACDDSFIPAQLGLAATLERQDDFSGAAQAYERILTQRPDAVTARTRLAFAARTARNGRGQQTTLRHWVPLGLTKMVRWWQAYCGWRSGKQEFVLSAFEKLQSEWPEDEGLRDSLATVLCHEADHAYSIRHYATALTLWQKAQALAKPGLEKHIAEVATRQAFLELRQMGSDGQNREATEKTIARAIALNPFDYRTSHYLSLLRFATGDPVGAVEILTRLLGTHPESSRCHYDLALAYLALGNGARARDQLAYVLPLVADSLVAFDLVLGYTAALQGLPAEAYSAYLRALRKQTATPGAQLDEREVDLWNNVVRQITAYARATGRGGEAMETLRQAQQAGSTIPSLALCLALLQGERGEIDEAIVQAEAFQSARPGDRDGERLLAILLAHRAATGLKEKHNMEAVADLAEAARLAPGTMPIRDALISLTGWWAKSALVTGETQEVAAVLEEHIVNGVVDFATFHWLALLLYRMVSPSGAKGTRVSQTVGTPDQQLWWRRTVLLWNTVLFSDDFWQSWHQRRNGNGSDALEPGTLEEVRASIGQRLLTDIRDFEAANKGLPAGHGPGALETLWAFESAGARAMREFVRGQQRNEWPGIACGPTMFSQLESRAAFREFAGRMRRELLDAQAPAAERLRWYLTPAGLGYHLLKEGHAEEAVVELSRFRDDPQVVRFLGEAFVKVAEEKAGAGVWPLAVEAYESAAANGVSLEKHSDGYAQAVIRAVEQDRQCETWDPNNAVAKLQRALAVGGKQDEVRQSLCVCYTDLTQAAVEKGKTTKALAFAAEALKYGADDLEAKAAAGVAHYAAGLAALQRGAISDGMQHFRLALAIGDSGDARQAISDTLFESELWVPAIEFFSKWFQENPADSAIRHNYAAILHNAGLEYARASKLTKAIEHLELAFEVGEAEDTRAALVQAYINRAVRHYEHDRLQSAKSDILKAFGYDPSNNELWKMYCSLL